MTLKELKQYCIDAYLKHPELKSEIISLYNLCIDEISEGDDEHHQINLCWADVKDLIEEANES